MITHSTVKIAQLLIKESDRFLQGLMGSLNALLYAACKFYGLTEKVGAVTKFFPKVLDRILTWDLTVTVPLNWMEGYLEKFWADAPRSVPTLRRMRGLLESLGIFVVEKQQFLGNVPKEERSGYVRATYNNFDVRAALKLYELLEKIWLERGHRFEELPEHRGAFVKHLYDLVFTGSVGMGRSGSDVPLTMEEAALHRAVQRQATNGTLNSQLDNLRADILNFRKIGLDRKEPELFGWMKAKWLEVKGAIDRRMADVPY